MKYNYNTDVLLTPILIYFYCFLVKPDNQ